MDIIYMEHEPTTIKKIFIPNMVADNKPSWY